MMDTEQDPEPPASPISLRAYRDTDADALPAIYRAAVKALGSQQYGPEQVEAWAALTPSASEYGRRAADGRSVWVAEDAEGRPVGYADIEADGHIDHLYCHPDVSGRGVGTALMLTIEAVARSLGLAELWVEASETARPLFERLGYRTLHRREIERDSVLLHNYAMTRALPALLPDVAPTEGSTGMMNNYASAGSQPVPATTAHQVVAFGDSATMMDELAALALSGTKRATAGLLRDFAGGEPMPFVGGHVVLVDGSRTPRAVWRTKEVQIGPLVSVDDAFAWDEGEGERTREDWLAMHRRYFDRAVEREGFAMHDSIATVFERFEIVWRAEAASGRQ